MAIEIEDMGAVCPLSADEIVKWAGQLGRAGRERQLQNIVTYWFHQARSFSRVSEETERARVRDYFRNRLDQGHSPDTITLPQHFHRIDKWLPDLSNRLNAIRDELLGLPGAVAAELRDRFGDYDKALDHLAILPVTLNSVAEAWYRPHPGQPSLEMESEAVGLLICAIEDFTEAEFPSPHSYKRLAEIEFAQLLVKRLFPNSTASQIDTMLRHFHQRRLNEMPGRACPPETVEYSS